MVALHNAGLLADDVQHEDPFVLFSGAGLLYQYWVGLRRKGDDSCLSPPDHTCAWWRSYPCIHVICGGSALLRVLEAIGGTPS